MTNLESKDTLRMWLYLHMQWIGGQESVGRVDPLDWLDKNQVVDLKSYD